MTWCKSSGGPQATRMYLSLQCVVSMKFCIGVLIIWMCVFWICYCSWLTADKNLQMSVNTNPHRYAVYSSLPAYPDYLPLLDVGDQIRTNFKILFEGYRKMFDQSFSNSKDLGGILRFLPGVVVQKHMNMQGWVTYTRLNRFYWSASSNLLSNRLNHPLITAILWMTICPVSCRIETVLSSNTVIPCFNISLSAVIFCLYWMEKMTLTFSRKFSVSLSFLIFFLNFDILLVLSSLNTSNFTSMTVQPPRFFFQVLEHLWRPPCRRNSPWFGI